jgi:hypothetical protein
MDNGDPQLLLQSVRRSYNFLTIIQRQEFLAQVDGKAS